jgi:hypothetical protein
MSTPSPHLRAGLMNAVASRLESGAYIERGTNNKSSEVVLGPFVSASSSLMTLA